jgi:hypothetical protein
MHRPAVLFISAILLAACGSTNTPSASPGQTSTASSSSSQAPTIPPTTPMPTPTATPPPALAALSVFQLPQATDLFRGAKVASMAGGRAGVVILGSDIATGALVSWTSADGDNWERHWLPGSTFGGGSPERLVGADFGYLAVGWRWDGTAFVDAPWMSVDGVTWSQLADDALPAGTIDALTAGPRGVVVAIGSSGGGSVIASSPDARSWRMARLPNVSASGLVPLPDGFLLVGTSDSLDSSGGTVSRNLVWRSSDGLTWAGDAALSNDIPGRPNSIEGWTLSPFGAVAWDLNGDVTRVTSTGLADLPRPPGYGHLVGSPAGLFWVEGTNSDGSCAVASQWDGTRWLALDSTSADSACVDAAGPIVLGSAPVADGAVMFGLLGGEYQRVAWLVRPAGKPPLGRPAGGPIAKAPPTSIPDPLTATFDHLSTCPAVPTTFAAVESLDPILGAGCFGDTGLTFRAWVVDPGEGYGGTCEAFTPTWIHECVLPEWLLSDGSGLSDGTGMDAMLHAMRSPAATGDLKGVGRWVQVTGHFDDPVSPTCRFNGDIGPVIGFEAEPPRAEAVLQCRLVFVVTHLRTVPAA